MPPADSDSAIPRTGTPQSHQGRIPVDPNEDGAGTQPSDTSGRADLEVERAHDGTSKSNDGETSKSDDTGTSKLNDSGRVEVQFDDDQMLLERDGKFRVVNTDDVMAEDEVRSRSSSSSSDAALRVSSMSVKTSSGGTRGRISGQRSSAQPPLPRSKSAITVPAVRRRSADYNSTHRLTEDQKRQLERQQAWKAKQAEEDEERRKEKEDKKRQECDDAFQAWLRRKRSEAAQRRRERIQEIREEKEKNTKNKVSVCHLFTDCLLTQMQWRTCI